MRSGDVGEDHLPSLLIQQKPRQDCYPPTHVDPITDGTNHHHHHHVSVGRYDARGKYLTQQGRLTKHVAVAEPHACDYHCVFRASRSRSPRLSVRATIHGCDAGRAVAIGFSVATTLSKLCSRRIGAYRGSLRNLGTESCGINQQMNMRHDRQRTYA